MPKKPKTSHHIPIPDSRVPESPSSRIPCYPKPSTLGPAPPCTMFEPQKDSPWYTVHGIRDPGAPFSPIISFVVY